MLSFMRDQQEHNQASAKAQTGNDQASHPGTQEYLTVAGKDQRTRQSTVVVIIMFVVGLAALGVMVKKCQPKAASAAPAKNEESQIEAAISRLTGVSAEMTSRMDQIVQKFHEFSAVAQVAVDELVRNPFELEAAKQEAASDAAPTPEVQTPPAPSTQVEVQVQSPPPVAPVAVPAPPPAETPEQAAVRLAAEEAKRKDAEEAARLAAEEAKRRAAEDSVQQYQQQVKRKATELKLQSILQSSTESRCLIDDALVRVGDRIKGFGVIQIGDNWVQLRWSEPPMPDMKIVLKLSE